MNNDNIYPNFGAPFVPTVPTEQKKKKQREDEETIAQYPLLKKVVERLNKRIEFYEKLDSIQVDIDKDPATFQKVHAANKLTRDNLKIERDFIMKCIKDIK